MHRKLGVLMMALGLAMLAGAAGLILHNRTEQAYADASAQVALDQIRVAMAQAEEPAEDETLPEEMPVMLIDGEEYIGYLEMPTIGVTLPVMKDWSYPKLRVAPCRYSGSPQDGAMVIMAHNYERHFGQIKDLPIGAPVQFIDANGRIYRYVVDAHDTLGKYDVEEMLSDGWDLTLFTCTYGGESRVTVRLKSVLTY